MSGTSTNAVTPKTVITGDEIKNFKLPESESFGPIPIYELSKFFSNALKGIYPLKNDQPSEDLKGFLIPLYNKVILDAKNFKAAVQVHNPKITPTNRVSLPGFPVYTEIQAEGKLLCAVVRGTPTISVRSQIVKASNNANVLVATPKVLSALISITLVGMKLKNTVVPAYLCANIFSSCKIPQALPEADNWGIHGHAGLNFVANFRKKFAEVCEEKYPGKGETTMQAFGWPPMEIFFFVAYKLDKAGDAANTLVSVIQSTGVTMEDLNGYLNLYKKEEWGDETGGAKLAMSNQFFVSMKQLDGSSSSGQAKKSDSAKADFWL